MHPGCFTSKQPNVLPVEGIGDLKLPYSNRLGCVAGVVEVPGANSAPARERNHAFIMEVCIGCCANTKAEVTDRY